MLQINILPFTQSLEEDIYKQATQMHKICLILKSILDFDEVRDS